MKNGKKGISPAARITAGLLAAIMVLGVVFGLVAYFV